MIFVWFQFIQDEDTHEKPQEPTTEKKGKTTKSTEKSADQNKKKQGDGEDKKKKKNEDVNEKRKYKGKKTTIEPSPSSGVPTQSRTQPKDPTGSAVSLRSNASTVKG